MTLYNQPEMLIRYGSKEPDDADPVLSTHDRHTVYSVQQFHYTNATRLGIVASGGLFVALTAVVNPMIVLVLSQIFTAATLRHLMCDLSLIEPTLFVCLLVYLSLKNEFKNLFPEGIFAPTDIGISNSHLRLHQRSYLFDFTRRKIAWDDVLSIEIKDKQFKASGQSPRIEPHLQIVDRFKRITSFRVAAIRTIEERRFLVNTFKRKAPRAIVGKDIGRLIRIGQINDIPFTKLWSRALNTSAGRVNTEVLAPGTLLQDGRLTIKSQIGGGGQGAVYSAELLEGGEPVRQVVLKEYVLPDREHTIERKRAVEMFEREVWALAKFKHAGIVKLFDAFVEDHRAYLVLEKLNGTSLKTHVSEHGPLTELVVCRLALKMCDILEYLHGFQPPVMHLDFSPENLVLDSENKVTLIDFNTCSDGTFPKKTVIGKQCYMAPEQYRSRPSTASDVYSLGATMFYLLTGKEPEPITVSKPGSVCSTAPELDTLVVKATALEQEDRPSIGTIKQELLALEQKLAAKSDSNSLTGK